MKNKQTIIIFEGHDKSGKSTIAKELSKRIEVPIFKVVRDNYKWDPDINLKYLTEGVTQFIEQSGTSIILDRWHPSDFMYNCLFNRENPTKKIFDIDERLAKLGALIVVCYKSEHAYEVDEEDKDFVNPTMYTDMTNLYRVFSRHTKCRVLFINTTNQDLEEQIKVITNGIENIW